MFSRLLCRCSNLQGNMVTMRATGKAREDMFSLRIVNLEYYTAPPLPGMDVCYSKFQGECMPLLHVIVLFCQLWLEIRNLLACWYPKLWLPCFKWRAFKPFQAFAACPQRKQHWANLQAVMLCI